MVKLTERFMRIGVGLLIVASCLPAACFLIGFAILMAIYGIPYSGAKPTLTTTLLGIGWGLPFLAGAIGGVWIAWPGFKGRNNNSLLDLES